MQTAQQIDLDARRGYLGASEAGAILGLDQYRTPLDVYNEKLGLVAPFGGNAHTMRGQRLEHIAAEEYERMTGEALLIREAELVHPDYAFIRGHVDRIAKDDGRIIEIKCPSIAGFRAHQRNGLPNSYILQAQVYMGLAGIHKLTWVLFCADAWDLITFDVEFDPDMYRMAVAGMADFWNNNVLAQQPPRFDANADKATIEFEKIGGDVTHLTDDEALTAAHSFVEARRILADAKMLEEMAKKQLLDAIDAKPGRYQAGPLRFYYNQQAGRRSFDQKRLAAVHPELDLEPFQKQGDPFFTFKPYIIGE